MQNFLPASTLVLMCIAVTWSGSSHGPSMLQPGPCIEGDEYSGQDVHYCGQCGTMCQNLVTFLQHKLCYSTSILPSSCLLCTENTNSMTKQDVHDHYIKVHGLKDVFSVSNDAKLMTGQNCDEHVTMLADLYRDSCERVSNYRGGSSCGIDKSCSESIVCDDGVIRAKSNVEGIASVITESDDHVYPIVHLIPDASTDISFIDTDDSKLEDAESVLHYQNKSDEITVISSHYKAIEKCASSPKSECVTVRVESKLGDNQIPVQLIHFESSGEDKCESIYEGDNLNTLTSIPNHIFNLSSNLSSQEDEAVLNFHEIHVDVSSVSVSANPDVELESGLNQGCGVGDYLCDICDFTTINVVDFQDHCIQSHQKKIFVLIPDLSRENLNLKSGLNNFQCTQDSIYTSLECDNGMNSGSKRGQTVRICKYSITSNGKREYKCHTCGKIFAFARSLRKHEFVHLNEKHFLCDTCGKAFKTTNSLSQHRKSHQKLAYICGECGFSSSIVAIIRTHRQLHPDGSAVCEICSIAYKDKSCLRSHMKVHDPIRPFPCQYPGCKWRFKSVGQANGHLFTHTSSGKYNCELCGYSFRYKQHLQRHLFKIHGINNTKILKTDDNTGSTALESSASDESALSIIDDDQLQIQNAPELVVCAEDSEGLLLNYEVGELSVACEALLQDDDDDIVAHTDECQTVGFLNTSLCT